MHTRPALLVLASLTLVAAGAVPASAAEEAPSSCPLNTRFLMNPGVTMSPQEFTFTQEGRIGPCAGSGKAGKFTVTAGKGNGSCPSAEAAAPFVVTWDGGGVSKGTFEGRTATVVALITGKITDGLYAGTPFQSYAVLNASGPLNCGTAGVTSAETYGSVIFG
jgi:hypothetical protein